MTERSKHDAGNYARPDTKQRKTLLQTGLTTQKTGEKTNVQLIL